MGLLRAFLALWHIPGLVLLTGGIETALGALVEGRHGNPHIALLGAIEGAAAALFLIPRAMRIGAAGLVGTIAVAFAVHTALGEFRGDLVVYAAAVLFVAVHGPLTRPQWQVAISRTTA